MLLQVDMDGVIVDFLSGAIPAVKRIWGIDILPEKVTTPSMHDAIAAEFRLRRWTPPSAEDAYSKLFSPGFFRCLPASEGAVKALKDLHTAGHTILIATKAHMYDEHIVREKAEWLKETLINIPYELMVVAEMSTKKYINSHVAIDDDPRALRGHPTAIPVCFSQPWNAEFRKNPDIGAVIISSMDQLPKEVARIQTILDEKAKMFF